MRSLPAFSGATPSGSGLETNFTILDTDDQLRLIKQIIAAAGVDDRRMPPRMLLSAFDRWKDRGLPPDKVPADEAAMVADGRGRELFRDYEKQRLLALERGRFPAICCCTI